MQSTSIRRKDLLEDGWQVCAFVAHMHTSSGQGFHEPLRLVAQGGDKHEVHFHARVLVLQSDRQRTDKQTKRQTDRQIHTQTHKQKVKQTDEK